MISPFNSATGLFEPVFLHPEGQRARTAETFEQTEHITVVTRALLSVEEFRELRDRQLERVLTQVEAFACDRSYARRP